MNRTNKKRILRVLAILLDLRAVAGYFEHTRQPGRKVDLSDGLDDAKQAHQDIFRYLRPSITIEIIATCEVKEETRND